MTGDNVSALAFCDVDDDGNKELLVRTNKRNEKKERASEREREKKVRRREREKKVRERERRKSEREKEREREESQTERAHGQEITNDTRQHRHIRRYIYGNTYTTTHIIQHIRQQ